MIKKMSLAVLGLTLSGLAAAGAMGPTCTPGNVTVPCEMKNWDLGVQALYLKPILDLDYGYGPFVQVDYPQIENDWDWGFRLEGSYHFGTGNDLTATWLHYNGSSYTYALNGVIPVNAQFTSTNQPFDMALNNWFDQVNMVLGQHVDVGSIKNMRFYGGLQYADITLNGNNHFARVPGPLAAAGVTSVTQFHNTDFNGVGPVAGLDYQYDLMNGFSVTANAAASILYGTARFDDGFVYNHAIVSRNYFGSMKRVVPGMEAKLGANYAYAAADGVLNIEAGYQVTNYFNALETRGVNPVVANVNDTDYGLYGPYFGVKWLGNA